MNITTQEYTNALITNAHFNEMTKAFKLLLTANGLPLSVELPVLKTHYKTQLFEKLLSIDKGLKMRYDMTKSVSGKLALIETTIDLDGYEIFPKLETLIAAMEKLYKMIYLTQWAMLWKSIPFNSFATLHNLDLEIFLQSKIIDWTGKEDIIALFRDLIPALTKLRSLFQATISTSYTIENTLHRLNGYYCEPECNAPFDVSEYNIFHLTQVLERCGKLKDYNKPL